MMFGITSLYFVVDFVNSYTQSALERWATCLLFGGRTDRDLARFVGLGVLRRIKENVLLQRGYRSRKG